MVDVELLVVVTDVDVLVAVEVVTVVVVVEVDDVVDDVEVDCAVVVGWDVVVDAKVVTVMDVVVLVDVAGTHWHSSPIAMQAKDPSLTSGQRPPHVGTAPKEQSSSNGTCTHRPSKGRHV